MNRPRWECPECGPVWHVWEPTRPDDRALCMTPHPAGGTCGLECRRHRRNLNTHGRTTT